jgi:hypothetical protein
VTDDQSQPTPGRERAIARLQLAGVVLLVFASVGARIIDELTPVSNWLVYGAAVSTVMTLFVVGPIIVGRIERRPARDVAMGALRETTSDLKKHAARLCGR